MGTVQNMDIAMLTRKIVRMHEEAYKSASANHNGMKQADKARALSYFSDIKNLLAFFLAQPELDMPEWTPTDIAIPDLVVGPMPENEAIVHYCTILQALFTEVVHCQSARDGAGVLSHDANRILAIVEKAEQFLEGYMSETLPIDYPESSPMRESTGSGKKTLALK